MFHIPQLVSVQTAKIGKTKEVGGARGVKGATHSCTDFMPIKKIGMRNQLIIILQVKLST